MIIVVVFNPGHSMIIQALERSGKYSEFLLGNKHKTNKKEKKETTKNLQNLNLLVQSLHKCYLFTVDSYVHDPETVILIQKPVHKMTEK